MACWHAAARAAEVVVRRRDVEVPESARVYALHPYGLGPARLMDTADLLAELSPDRMLSRRSGRDLIET